MFKKLLCIFLCISMLFLFAACDFSGGKDAYIIFPIDSDPGYLDPQIISDPGAKNIIANCFEGLVALDENGAIVPGCAESWTVSPDGLVYTFNLRKNLKWAVMNSSSDFLGEDFKKTFDSSLTAEDFVFGFRRALLPETKSPGAKNLLSIKNADAVNKGTLPADRLGVTATNSHTLTITLTMADSDFLYILLEPECMPCDQTFFEKTGGRYGLSTRFLMYNGPFYLANWADDTAFTLYRNDEYHSVNDVKPGTLYISVNNEQSTRLNKIKDETYDVSPLTAEQAQMLSENSRYTTLTFQNGMYGLIFNCADEALKSIDIRKAITSSLDLNLLYSELGQGNAKGILPEDMLISGQKYRNAAGEVKFTATENPQQLLKMGLAYLDRDDVEVKILCTESQQNAVRKIMQKWQATLGIGFNIFIDVSTEDEIRQKIIDGDDWQLALTNVSFPSLTAFNGLLQFTTDNASNLLGFSDIKFDNLVSKIKEASGQAASVAATKAAEEYLISQCPFIPLYNHPVYYGLGKGVEGVIFNSTGDVVYFKNTTVK